MLLYYTLCALCVLTVGTFPVTGNFSSDQESMLRILTALNNNLNSSGLELKAKREVTSVLNPIRKGHPSAYEDIESHIFSYFSGIIPKITIWEFPTERRVFVDDVEIFIKSNEKEDSTEDFMIQNNRLKHPHSSLRDLHKDIINGEEIPAFRPPVGRDIKKSDVDVKDNPIKSSISSTKVNLLRDKRSIEDKEKESKLEDEVAENSENDRNKVSWILYDYLRWLLKNMDEATTSQDDEVGNSGISKNDNYNLAKTSESIESDDQLYDSPTSTKSTVQDTDNNKDQIETPSEINQQFPLLPVDPKILKAMQDEIENVKTKRNINTNNKKFLFKK